jgi:hypothetical protein
MVYANLRLESHQGWVLPLSLDNATQKGRPNSGVLGTANSCTVMDPARKALRPGRTAAAKALALPPDGLHAKWQCLIVLADYDYLAHAIDPTPSLIPTERNQLTKYLARSISSIVLWPPVREH